MPTRQPKSIFRRRDVHCFADIMPAGAQQTNAFLWTVSASGESGGTEGRLDHPDTTESHLGGEKETAPCSLMGKQISLGFKGASEEKVLRGSQGWATWRLLSTKSEDWPSQHLCSLWPPGGLARMACSYAAMHRGQSSVSHDVEAGENGSQSPVSVYRSG